MGRQGWASNPGCPAWEASSPLPLNQPWPHHWHCAMPPFNHLPTVDEQTIIHITEKFNCCLKLHLTRLISILFLRKSLSWKKITRALFWQPFLSLLYSSKWNLHRSSKFGTHSEATCPNILCLKGNLLLKMLTSFLSRGLFWYLNTNLEINNNHYEREEKLTLK